LNFHGLFNNDKPFISWAQDSDTFRRMSFVAKEDLASSGKDYFIGYTDEFETLGFNPHYLCRIPMIINQDLFTTDDQPDPVKKLVFVSNRGNSPYAFAANVVAPMFGLDEYRLMDRINLLSQMYKTGEKLIGYAASRAFFLQDPILSHQISQRGVFTQDKIFDMFLYWGINERIYRQTVIDWLIEIGIDFELYGAGWSTQYKYKKFTADDNVPTYELQWAYNRGEFGLHLNSYEGYHNRIIEVILAGRKCISRGNEVQKQSKQINKQNFEPEQDMMVENILMACSEYQKIDCFDFTDMLNVRPYCSYFNDKESLANLLGE